MVIFQMFFSDLYNCNVRPVYHTIIWAWIIFHLIVFSINIHKKCKSNHSLLILVILYDLKMTQFWSLTHICLVYKSNFLLWTCLKFWQHLWQICSHCIWNCFIWNCNFLVLFGDCVSFLTNNFSKSYINVFFLSKKQQNWF